MAFNFRKLLGWGSYPDNTGLGPDFPGSAGDRERGKFRESGSPRLTMVAVCDDEGDPVGQSTDDLLEEVLNELRLLRVGMVMAGQCADVEEEIQT